MGRIRSIKPGFFTNEELSSLRAEVHLLAGGLLCYCDDEGYFNANPALVKAAIFPLREPSLSIHDMLTDLSATEFIRLGAAADGKRYGQVVKFTEHQRVNRPTPSKIKNLEIQWDDSLSPHGGLTEDSLPEGKGKEGKYIARSVSPGITLRAPDDRQPGVLFSQPESENAISAPPPAFTFSLECTGKDKRRFEVTAEHLAELRDLFPGVDVLHELRRADRWLKDNPAKRKTYAGMNRFLSGWCQRQQNRGGHVSPANGKPAQPVKFQIPEEHSTPNPAAERVIARAKAGVQ